MTDKSNASIPNPSALPPVGHQRVKTIPSLRKRVMQALSYTLIIGGFMTIAVGLFLPLRNEWLLLRNPPPAAGEKILSLADNPLPVMDAATVSEATKTATPTFTPAPTFTPTSASTSNPATEASAPAFRLPTPTFTLTPTATPLPNPYPPAQSPPTRIVAESIGLDSPVVKVGWHQETIDGQTVSVWDVAEYAAGWHKNSALPGHTGNIVLSGHHNILGEVFRYIVDLEPGDKITLYADSIPYDYIVQEKFILKDKGEPEEVRRANARWIGPFDDQRLTLVTCWPYDNNTHRVVVIAKPPTETASR